MTTAQALLRQLKTVPDKPGVYVFKDAGGKVLYVGKGRSLKKRMRSYFQKSHPYSPKTKILVDKIADFDFHVTDSEVEALVLECNLIKQHRPRFNVSLKDDKSYPSIAITMDDEFPRVVVTRKLGVKGARYFGPYTNPRAVRETLNTLRRIFPVRYCRGKVPGRQRGGPCLNFHIERCLGPCVDGVSQDAYAKMIGQICLFLEGRQEKLMMQMEQDMKEAAQKLDFEKAARLRNRIEAARSVLEKQKVVSKHKEDRDVFGFFADDDFICFAVLLIRSGKLLGSENFILEKDGLSESELLSSFVKQFYFRAAFVPRAVLLQGQIEDQDTVRQWLSKREDKTVKLLVPKRDEKRKLVELARENARASFAFLRLKKEFQNEQALKAVNELREELELPVIPYRIEAFDISTWGGRESVGSMVVFENGKAKKKDYRRFKIRSVRGQDDSAMMAEVIKRRITAYHEEKEAEKGSDEGKFSQKPDLIVVDGGKPQLSAALRSLQELHAQDIPVIALAKREEEIFLPYRRSAANLVPSSPGLRLVQSIRDEAHRFAVSYHRGLRNKKITESFLDEIPGIGEKRKLILIKHFGSPNAVFTASMEELAEVPKMPASMAQKLYNYLHKNSEPKVLRK